MNSNEAIKATLEPSKKPLNVLVKQLNSHIAITLKNGIEYRGNMVKCDGHMNIILEGATECMKDQLLANYGSVLVRGNNVLYIAIDQSKK
jgi:small nuclear ribonucleoprotein